MADAATYFEKRVGLKLVALPVAKDTMRGSPEAVARAARTHLKMKPGPVSNMIRVAERAGAVVTYAKTQRLCIDAYSLEIGDWPIIVLTPKGDYYRQRWDVAHELGHLLMHRSAQAIDADMEHEANQFAAEFLLPASAVPTPSSSSPRTPRRWLWTQFALLGGKQGPVRPECRLPFFAEQVERPGLSYECREVEPKTLSGLRSR